MAYGADEPYLMANAVYLSGLRIRKRKTLAPMARTNARTINCLFLDTAF